MARREDITTIETAYLGDSLGSDVEGWTDLPFPAAAPKLARSRLTRLSEMGLLGAVARYLSVSGGTIAPDHLQ